MDQDTERQVLELRVFGLGGRRIAKKLGLPYGRVRRVLEKSADTPLRYEDMKAEDFFPRNPGCRFVSNADALAMSPDRLPRRPPQVPVAGPAGRQDAVQHLRGPYGGELPAGGHGLPPPRGDLPLAVLLAP